MTTLVALYSTLVSQLLGGRGFQTNVASRLASLFLCKDFFSLKESLHTAHFKQVMFPHKFYVDFTNVSFLLTRVLAAFGCWTLVHVEPK